MTTPQFRVLLIEDNPADVELTREAFGRNHIPVDFDVADSGPAALAHLASVETVPELVILDLNIPGIPGTDVLTRIRGDVRTRTVPVIVMTTSASERDIAASYERGANAYVVKPFDLASFEEAIRALKVFWLSVARLPGSRTRPAV